MQWAVSIGRIDTTAVMTLSDSDLHRAEGHLIGLNVFMDIFANMKNAVIRIRTGEPNILLFRKQTFD
jgi:hypothetical protein